MNAPVLLRDGLLRRTKGAPHVRNEPSVDSIMAWFLAASLPAFLFGTWSTGERLAEPEASVIGVMWSGLSVVLPRLVTFFTVGYAMSLANAFLRRQKGRDASWLLVAWFMLLLLPPEVPLWQSIPTLIFASAFVLFVFGGYGMAPFHPVVAGGVFIALTFGDPGRIVSGDVLSSSWYRAMATPGNETFSGLLLGGGAGGLGAASPLLIAVAGAVLIIVGHASWRTIVAGTLSAIIAGVLLPLPAAENWYSHILLGQFLFVLVFLAADPGAQALTIPARWIAGLSFGALTVLLRVIDPAHPEASLTALLLVSLCTPLADSLVVRWSIWRRGRLRGV